MCFIDIHLLHILYTSAHEITVKGAECHKLLYLIQGPLVSDVLKVNVKDT